MDVVFLSRLQFAVGLESLDPDDHVYRLAHRDRVSELGVLHLQAQGHGRRPRLG